MKNVADKLYMRTVSTVFALFAAFVMFMFVGKSEAQAPPAGSPVARHGNLRTEGNRIVNQHGEPVQLRGMSLFWSHSRTARHFYNATTIGHLRNDWQGDVVRAAMAVNMNWSNDEQSFLGGDETGNRDRVIAVINAAIQHGMYVIVDWHAYYRHPGTNQQSSMTWPDIQRTIGFFTGLSTQFAGVPNIIWEIFNEPVGPHQGDQAAAAAFWAEIKPRLEQVAQAIRANNDNRVIITGTPFFCQAPDIAAANPLRMTNGVLIPHVAYSAHFYAAGPGGAGTGGAGLDDHNIGLKRRIIRTMSEHNLPVFISEWGTVRADGAGNHDGPRSTLWMEFLEQYKVGWATWSLSSMNQGSAALVGDAQTLANQATPWTDSQLSESGRFLREELRRTEPRTRRFASVRFDLVGTGTIVSTPPALVSAGQDTITATVRLISPDYPFIGWSTSNGASGTGTPVQGQSIPTFRVAIPTTPAMITSGGVADGGEIVVTLRFEGPNSVLNHANRSSTAWGVSNSSGLGIRLYGPSDAGATVTLYDVRGKIAKRKPAQNGMVIGSGMAAGSYLLVVRSSAGREVHKSRVTLAN
ncbi:MAG: cellulase family glycosylhydrolase [Chitinispirillia bacterium]|nr:cellulase family glycosylhydrolase [Chitinispirillia bacterium]